MKLEANGKLPVGRMITVTGTIDNVSEVYLKDGQPVLRKRPELKLPPERRTSVEPKDTWSVKQWW